MPATQESTPSVTHGLSSPVVVQDILDRAASVAATEAFPTTDALLDHFHALAETDSAVIRRQIATSRLGEPIYSFAIGAGSRNMLVVGGVHPNEPIGSITAMHLADALIDDVELLDSFDATWHIIPTIDPDGGRLNEPWFAVPEDRRTYYRNFYRPAGHEQIEWTFPAQYRDLYFDAVLPESLGLMRLIDELRPSLYVSLHNAESGGVYYYVSEAPAEMVQALHAIPDSLGLPLDTGEPESTDSARVAPGIYISTTIAEQYEHLESVGLDPVASLAGHGSSSTEYAERYGAFSLIAEMPQWVYPQSDDDTPTEQTHSELLFETGRQLQQSGQILQSLLEHAEPHLTLDSPYLRAARAFIPAFTARGEANMSRANGDEHARAATVAEQVSCRHAVSMFRLRYGGMLLRAIDTHLYAGVARVQLRHCHEQLLDHYARWEAEVLEQDVISVPLAKLSGLQYGAILAAATHVAGKDS